MQQKHQSKNSYRILTRWMRSKLQRVYEWQLSSSYWIIVHRWQKIGFWVRKQVFEMGIQLQSGRESIPILVSILQAVLGQILLAIFLVGGLIALERLLPTYSGIVRPNSGLLSKLQLDSTTYANMLGILAQIAGVFIGLYFTAVSVVASTVYARVPDDVRALLMREKAGNIYIRVVALLGVMTTLLLALHILGFGPGFFSLFLVTFLSVIAIFGFVVLGLRIFYFFNPTALVDYLTHDLYRWLLAATPRGFQWHNPSFQAHYQRQAESLFGTYRRVIDLATQQEYLPGHVLNGLALQALGLLRSYTAVKYRIPSNSLWFKKVPQHRDWLTTDYSQVAIALHTGTPLQPDITSDLMWFESQTGELILSVLQNLLKRDDIRSAVMLGNDIQLTLHELGKHLALDEALRLYRTLTVCVYAQARHPDFTAAESASAAEQTTLYLALIDIYSAGLSSVILGVSNRLSNMTPEVFSNTIDEIRWNRVKTIYTTGLPRAVLEQLEYLQKRLEFERQVEGRTISPKWYQQQIAALGFMRWT